MALVMLAALIAAPVDPTQAEMDASVAAITKLGGTVTRDAEGNVTAIKLGGVDNGAIGLLKPFTGLKSLTLVADLVTDDGVIPIFALKQLEYLAIGGRRLTNATYGRIATLQRLTSLSLCRITDSALSHLSSMRNLSRLSLSITNVTDEGLGT